MNGQTFDLTLDDCVTGLTVAAPDDGAVAAATTTPADAAVADGAAAPEELQAIVVWTGALLVAGNERYLAGVTRIGGAEAGQPRRINLVVGWTPNAP
ncbi:MAG: hypothetical protein R2715_17065 [Ilumatobacteraceae bacterium]